MPGFTSPDSIYYPVAGDVVGPLETHFATQSASVQAAITALRAAAVPAALPAPIFVKGADAQAVTVTAWGDLPNIAAASLVLPAAAWVQITVSAWTVASAGDTRVSASVSGATTLGESQGEVGGVTSAWGHVMYTNNTTGSNQGTSVRIVRLAAGTNTIKVRAYRNGAGTNQSNYTTLAVTPLRWA
jgi:hypothetical protein